MGIHITNGEKAIIGRLLFNKNSPNYVMSDGCVCKKAYVRWDGGLINVKVHFSSKNKIDKVYIENEVWDVKEQYIDILDIGKCYKLKARRRKSLNVITELPEPEPEQEKESNSKEHKK